MSIDVEALAKWLEDRLIPGVTYTREYIVGAVREYARLVPAEDEAARLRTRLGKALLEDIPAAYEAGRTAEDEGWSGPCVECGWYRNIWPEDSTARAAALQRHRAHAGHD
jgi:hypothetical protein